MDNYQLMIKTPETGLKTSGDNPFDIDVKDEQLILEPGGLELQEESLKLLVDKMHELRREFYGTPLSIHFRHPTIHIMVLFVDELESVARQLKRGRETLLHNSEVMRTGIGHLNEDRPTDHDEGL